VSQIFKSGIASSNPERDLCPWPEGDEAHQALVATRNAYSRLRAPKRSPTTPEESTSPTSPNSETMSQNPSQSQMQGAASPGVEKPLYLCQPFVKAALVKGSFKTIVAPPKYVDVNEWVAINSEHRD
jgi:hypothetical protein